MPDRDESAGSTWGPVVGVAVFGIALVVGAASWPALMYTTGLAAHLPFKGSDDQEDRIGPIGSRFVQLNLIDHELFVQGRDGYRLFDLAEVVKASLKEILVG